MKKNKVFIIAEAGVNHNGSLDMAKNLAKASFEAGADAVKFQIFNCEKLMTKTAPKANYQLKNTNGNETQYEMLKQLELTITEYRLLKDYCDKIGIQFLATPFDELSLKFLTKGLSVNVVKIGSGEITNAPLLLEATKSNSKVILSTGMSTLGEIEDALGVLAYGYSNVNNSNTKPSASLFQSAYSSKKGFNAIRKNVSLLHCTTEYPAPFADTNLLAIKTMNKCFGVKVGYSDHTKGIAIPIAAVALGARMIEKHITLDKSLPGPDHVASLEPLEFKEMVQGIRQTELALGKPYKKPGISESKNRSIARKSIVAARNISEDEFFTAENLTSKRPGNGISPMHYWDFIGVKAQKAYAKDEVIK